MKSKKKFLGIFFTVCILLVVSFFTLFFILGAFWEDSENENNGNVFTKMFNGFDNLPEDLDFEKIYTVSELSNHLEDEKIWLISEYSGEKINTLDVNDFGVQENENVLFVDVADLETPVEFESGNYLLVEGVYKDSFPSSLEAISIKILPKNYYEDLLFGRYPAVEMEILDEDLILNHGCENASVTVKIKNVGRLPIDYLKTGTENTEYAFISYINGEIWNIFPDSNFDDEDNIPVGYLNGFRNFGVLNPGEEKEVRFGMGGKVEDSYDQDIGEKFGTAGLENIFCVNQPEGSREATFYLEFGNVMEKDRGMWVSQTYDFVNRYNSNEILVKVLDCECNLSSESLPESL